MAFQFSLATVLRFRGMVEEREEGILQKILSDIAQTFDELERTDALLEESNAARRADIFKPSIGLQIHAFYGEVKELKQRRKDLEGQMLKLEQARDEQLVVYEAARRNREMLTDMHERKHSAYLLDMNKRAQKALDDNYIARRGNL
jgi:flagellar export protein FliJ